MNRDVEPLKPTDPRSFGGWKIKGRLGEGGYSTIFLGEKSGELAAVKMIRKELLSDLRVFERFATEINNLERIDHPGIAKIIESDLSTGVPYIAIEYIKGETLEQKVEASGPLKEAEWVDCLVQVAAALDYCHRISIIHKDVSPGNIILSKEGPKLIDFGISYHHGDQRVTQPDQTVGTLPYMSPEHWDSEPRSEMDIFSLGSTFTFAGTGHSAFIGETNQESRAAIWHVAPNFEGLSENQINLLTPLLYKNFKDRPSLSELVDATNLLRENSELTVYKTFLKGSDEKLVKSSDFLGEPKKSSKSRVLLPLGALVAVFFSVYVITGVSDQTSTSIDRSSTEQTTLESIDPSNSASTTSTLIDDNSILEGKPKSPKNSPDLESCYKAVETNKQNVATLCLAAAAQGDLKSIWYLGSFYRDSGNYKSAAEWFLKGAKKDDYQSMLGLVRSYEKLGLEAERTKWLETCAKGFYGVSSNSPKSAIGTCKLFYAMDLNRAGDQGKAILYLKDAISYGNGDAATYLGIIYRDQGKTELAQKSYEDGVRLGNDTSLAELILLLEEKGDDKGVIKWLTVAAEGGDENAKRSLAGRYYFLQKDFINAKKWALECGKAGIGECNYILGELATADKQNTDAKKYYTLAHNQGVDRATIKLATIFWLKENNLPESKKVLQKLLAKGDFLANSIMVGISLDLNDLPSACMYARQVPELADKKKNNGDWTTQDSEFLANNEKVLNDLCKSNA